MTGFPIFMPSRSLLEGKNHTSTPAKPANPAKANTEIRNFRNFRNTSFDDLGNVIDFTEAAEERAAIKEYDAPDIYPNRQAATDSAYEECQIIFLEGARK